MRSPLAERKGNKKGKKEEKTRGRGKDGTRLRWFCGSHPCQWEIEVGDWSLFSKGLGEEKKEGGGERGERERAKEKEEIKLCAVPPPVNRAPGKV